MIPKYINISDQYTLKEENYDNALKYFKKALDLDSNSDIAYKGMGAAYMKSGLYDEAASAFDKGRKLKEDPDTDLQLAESYIKLNKSDDAKAVLQEIKAKFPNYKNMSTVDNYLSQL